MYGQWKVTCKGWSKVIGVRWVKGEAVQMQAIE